MPSHARLYATSLEVWAFNGGLLVCSCQRAGCYPSTCFTVCVCMPVLSEHGCHTSANGSKQLQELATPAAISSKCTVPLCRCTSATTQSFWKGCKQAWMEALLEVRCYIYHSCLLHTHVLVGWVAWCTSALQWTMSPRFASRPSLLEALLEVQCCPGHRLAAA